MGFTSNPDTDVFSSDYQPTKMFVGGLSPTVEESKYF